MNVLMVGVNIQIDTWNRTIEVPMSQILYIKITTIGDHLKDIQLPQLFINV